MNDYSVKKILAKKKQIRLPECTYCSIRCWECRYFETDAPDSKGQCRCSYRGRWYYPHEGCGNGKPWNPPPTPNTYLHKPNPIPKPEPIPNPIPKPEPIPDPIPNPEPSHGGMGIIFLLVAGIAILFSMGLIKSTLNFKMNGIQLKSVRYTEYSLNAVRMDDGSNSYPKNFSAFTVESEAFNEYGKGYIELKKGGYDLWISYDGVSGYASSVDINKVFDKDVSFSTANLESGMLRIVILHLKDKSGNPVVESQLHVICKDLNNVKCTPYGEVGSYIVVLPNAAINKSVITLTIQAAGFADCDVELDFKDGRIFVENVKLTEK